MQLNFCEMGQRRISTISMLETEDRCLKIALDESRTGGLYSSRGHHHASQEDDNGCHDYLHLRCGLFPKRYTLFNPTAGAGENTTSNNELQD